MVVMRLGMLFLGLQSHENPCLALAILPRFPSRSILANRYLNMECRKVRDWRVKMDEIEVLARMWLVVDPNRSRDPDEIGNMYGEYKDKPNWEWFKPRAEGSIEFLKKNGYRLVKDG